MKKVILLLIIPFLLLVACNDSSGSNNATSEKTTINFWKPPHGEDEEIFSELIEKFEEENPDIEVEHTIVPWESVDQQFQTAFAGNEPPDVAYMPDEWYSQYANEGELMDITENFKEISDGWDPHIAALGQYKGVQYGVPHITATQAFIYNEDLLEDAGYTEPPKTIEEFREMSIAITDETKNIYGYSDAMLGFNNQFWGPLFEAEGVKLLNEDLTEATFNNSKAVEIVEYIVDLYESGATVPRNRFTEDQQDEQITQGNIAFANKNYDVYATYMNENPDLNLEVTHPPATTSGEFSQAAFYGFLFVAEKSNNKEEAWQFIKYLTNNENLEHYASSVSMFSTRNDSDWWEDDPVAETFATALENAPGVIPTIHWREMSRIIGEEIDFAIAGQKTAQEALDDAESAVNEILDGN